MSNFLAKGGIYISDILDKIVDHMELIGYKIQQTDEGAFIAQNDIYHINLTFKQFSYGILFTLWAKTSDKAKNDKSGMMDAVNNFNTKALVTRCYTDKELDLCIEAWYPPYYEKATFGAFLETIRIDIDNIRVPEIRLMDYLT